LLEVPILLLLFLVEEVQSCIVLMLKTEYNMPLTRQSLAYCGKKAHGVAYSMTKNDRYNFLYLGW